ncbi:hypothetical protein [Salmonella enterica]|uniref:hypothetical protein n=1 Tax=Salmonella enterica TaxID=28901 RepID=UPI0035BE9249
MRIGPPQAEPAGTFSKIWISDRTPRKLDMLSLMSMSDAFFGRIFHARRELVPFGTVSLTTYFHTDSDALAAEDITRVLATAIYAAPRHWRLLTGGAFSSKMRSNVTQK